MAALAESPVRLESLPPRRSSRVWLSLLSFCVLRGVAVALIFSIVLVGATLAGGQARHVARNRFRPQAEAGPQTLSGMVTDSNCGARHRQNGNLSSAECAHACVRNGAKYVLVDGEKVVYLEGHPRQLGKFAGQRVEIRGTRTGDSIQVDTIAPQ